MPIHPSVALLFIHFGRVCVHIDWLYIAFNFQVPYSLKTPTLCCNSYFRSIIVLRLSHTCIVTRAEIAHEQTFRVWSVSSENP